MMINNYKKTLIGINVFLLIAAIGNTFIKISHANISQDKAISLLEERKEILKSEVAEVKMVLEETQPAYDNASEIDSVLALFDKYYASFSQEFNSKYTGNKSLGFFINSYVRIPPIPVGTKAQSVRNLIKSYKNKPEKYTILSQALKSYQYDKVGIPGTLLCKNYKSVKRCPRNEISLVSRNKSVLESNNLSKNEVALVAFLDFMNYRNIYDFSNHAFKQESVISSTSTSSTKDNDTKLVPSNLLCTKNLKSLFGKSRPDYCRSSSEDSGILFDAFDQEKRENGSIRLKMDVFNRGSADGLVEVYDSSGKLQEIKIIDGNRPPSDLLKSGYDLFVEVPISFFSKYPIDDYRRNLDKQNIEVVVPPGGSVKITKSSQYAVLYNSALAALEISQLKSGDPGFAKSDSVQDFLIGFVQEFGSKSAINIFKSEPTIQGVFSHDFLDQNELAKVLHNLIKYSIKVEKNPTKNPFIGAFTSAYIDIANIGIENILDKYILPGLGTFVREVRVGGNAVNTYARSADLKNAMVDGDRGTITLDNK